MCLLIVRVQRSSPRQHASIHPGLVSFPSLYSLFLNRKIFHLLVSFLFLLHTAYYYEEYIAWGYLLLFTHLLCLCPVVGIVLCMYANFHCYNCYEGPVIGIFKERLPEAICCCLQTCNVDVVLLAMYCMYLPGFIVTSADISQLWVYLCYLLIYCLRLFVVVYKLVMFMERG